jgi:hypothetical protein
MFRLSSASAPQDHRGLYNQGMQLASAGIYAQALESFKKAAVLFPLDSDYLIMCALLSRKVKLKKGEYEKFNQSRFVKSGLWAKMVLMLSPESLNLRGLVIEGENLDKAGCSYRARYMSGFLSGKERQLEHAITIGTQFNLCKYSGGDSYTSVTCDCLTIAENYIQAQESYD